MTFAKPWKPEAVVRLMLSVFVCVYGGSLGGCVLHFAQAGGKTGAGVFYPLAAGAVACLAATLVLLRRPLALEGLLPRLATVLGGFYGGLLAGVWVHKFGGTEEPSIGQMVVGTCCAYGLGLFLAHRFVREHDLDWAEAFGFRHGWREALVLGLIAAVVFLPLGRMIEQASAWGLTHFAPQAMKPEEQRVVQVLRTAVSWSERGLLGAITILIAPVAEEVFFRGVLYPTVKQCGFPRLALWGTAALFGFIHFNVLTFLPLTVLALLLTLLYERTGNLLAPIAAHSLFNAVNFALLYYFQKP